MLGIKLQCGQDQIERDVAVSNAERQYPIRTCIGCKQRLHLSQFVPIYNSTIWTHGNHFNKIFVLSHKCIKCFRVTKIKPVEIDLNEPKKCGKCAQIKLKKDFPTFRKTDKDGFLGSLNPWCRVCLNLAQANYARDRYQNDPKFRKKHSEYMREYQRKRRALASNKPACPVGRLIPQVELNVEPPIPPNSNSLDSSQST